MEVNYSKGSWKVDILPVMENGVYTIELSSEQYNAPIYYTLDGTEPTESAEKYTGPIRIDKSTVINAALFDNGKLKEYPSTKEIVFHKGIGAGTTLVNPPARSYYAGGAGSLVDGLMGSDNFRDGYWLGFEGTDVDVLIDLGENMEVASVSADFYQNTGAWIFLPPMVTISLLDKDHGLLAERTVEPESTMEVKGTIIEELSSDFDLINARFVHLTASGITSIPDWLEGAGNKGWLFIDEVVVK